MTLQPDDESWQPPMSLIDQQQEKTKQDALNEVRRWIESITDKSFSQPDNILASLANGVILCELVNKLKPGTIRKINRLPGPIAGMDNLSVFLNVCETVFGLPKTVLFQPNDLEDLTQRALDETQVREEINKRSLRVVICLFHLAKSTESLSSDSLNYSIFNSLVLKQVEYKQPLSADRRNNLHKSEAVIDYSPRSSPTPSHSVPHQSQSVNHSKSQHLSSSLNSGGASPIPSYLKSTIGLSKSLDCSTPRRSSVPDPLQFVKVTKESSLAQKASEILTEVAKNKAIAKETPHIMEDDEWQESLSFWREKRRKAPPYSQIRDLNPENEEEIIAQTRSKIKSFKDMTSSGTISIPSIDEDNDIPRPQPKSRASRWSKLLPNVEDDLDLPAPVTSAPNSSIPPSGNGETTTEQTFVRTENDIKIDKVSNNSPKLESESKSLKQNDIKIDKVSNNSPQLESESKSLKQNTNSTQNEQNDVEKPNEVAKLSAIVNEAQHDNNSPIKSPRLKPPILSNKKETTIKLTRPAGSKVDFGIKLTGCVENGEDVVIERVKIGSTADICDIRKGDFLRGINDTRVTDLKSLQEVEEKLSEATGVVKLRILRHKSEEDDFSDEFSEDESVRHQWSPGTLSPLSPRGTLEKKPVDDADGALSRQLADETRISTVQLRNKFFGLNNSQEESETETFSIKKYALAKRTQNSSNSENSPFNNNSLTRHSVQAWSPTECESALQFKPLSERVSQLHNRQTPPTSPPHVPPKPAEKKEDSSKVVSSITMRLSPSKVETPSIDESIEISVSSAYSDKKVSDDSVSPEPQIRMHKIQKEESKSIDENHNTSKRPSSLIEKPERSFLDRVQTSTLPRGMTLEEQIEAIDAADKRMSRSHQRYSATQPANQEKIKPSDLPPTSIRDVPVTPQCHENTQKSASPENPPSSLPPEPKSPRPAASQPVAAAGGRPVPPPPCRKSDAPPPVPPKQGKDNRGNRANVPVVSSKKQCCYCNQRLGSGDLMVIEAMQLYFHLQCFRCFVCGVSLGSGRSDVDVRVRMSRLHCPACYAASEQQVPYKIHKRKGLRCSDV